MFIWLTLYIELTQLFSPGSVSIHSTGLTKIVKIYRFDLNFWAVKGDIEREYGLSDSFSIVVRKVKNLLFVRFSNIISIQNNLTTHYFRTRL